MQHGWPGNHWIDYVDVTAIIGAAFGIVNGVFCFGHENEHENEDEDEDEDKPHPLNVARAVW